MEDEERVLQFNGMLIAAKDIITNVASGMSWSLDSSKDDYGPVGESLSDAHRSLRAAHKSLAEALENFESARAMM